MTLARRNALGGILLVAACGFIVRFAQAQTTAGNAATPKTGGGTTAAADAKKGPAASAAGQPAVEPQADKMLRDMSDYLKASQQLTFHADITFDDLLPTGQKIELAAAYDVALRRPDRVYSEYWGDAGDRRLWYDGSTLTLYDPAAGVYASQPAKPTIDATLNSLIEVWDSPHRSATS